MPVTMKIGKVLANGNERVGIFEDTGEIKLLGSEIEFRNAISVIHEGGNIDDTGNTVRVDEVTFLPPVSDSNLLYGAVYNYQSENKKEKEVPERPLLFIKPYHSLLGHGNKIRISNRNASMVFEGELAISIGKECWNVSSQEASDYVAGYTLVNDVTDQKRINVGYGNSSIFDWLSGKCKKSSTPVGPFVKMTRDFNPGKNHQIRSFHNDDLVQNSNTELMIRRIPDLIEHISNTIPLQPGDIITTGSPSFLEGYENIQLAEGDKMEISVDGIGSLVNKME